jgi:hypothetical protein
MTARAPPGNTPTSFHASKVCHVSPTFRTEPDFFNAATRSSSATAAALSTLDFRGITRRSSERTWPSSVEAEVALFCGSAAFEKTVCVSAVLVAAWCARACSGECACVTGGAAVSRARTPGDEATSIDVRPSVSQAMGSAPRSRSHFTDRTQPKCAATCKHVTAGSPASASAGNAQNSAVDVTSIRAAAISGSKTSTAPSMRAVDRCFRDRVDRIASFGIARSATGLLYKKTSEKWLLS